MYAATFNSRALNKEDFSKLMKTVLPKVKKRLQRSYWNGLKGDRDSSGAEGLNKDMAMGGLLGAWESVSGRSLPPFYDSFINHASGFTNTGFECKDDRLKLIKKAEDLDAIEDRGGNPYKPENQKSDRGKGCGCGGHGVMCDHHS